MDIFPDLSLRFGAITLSFFCFTHRLYGAKDFPKNTVTSARTPPNTEAQRCPILGFFKKRKKRIIVFISISRF